MQQLVLAIGQVFEHDRLGQVRLAEFDELEAHDTLIRGQRWHRLAHIVAAGLIKVGLKGTADRVEIECQQYPESLKKLKRIVAEIITKCSLCFFIYGIIEIEGIGVFVFIPASSTKLQTGNYWIKVICGRVIRIYQLQPINLVKSMLFLDEYCRVCSILILISNTVRSSGGILIDLIFAHINKSPKNNTKLFELFYLHILPKWSQ